MFAYETESSEICFVCGVPCIYACIHDELMQAPEVCQETGRAACSVIFSEETRVE